MRRNLPFVIGSLAAALVISLAPPASARPDVTVHQGSRRTTAPFTTGAVRSLAAEAGMTDFLAAFQAWLDQPDVESFEWWSRQFVADWSGDGLADDVSIHQVFTLDGTALRTVATLRVAEGDTGRILWSRRWKRDEDTTVFFPIEARVGPRGVPGMIVAEVSGARFGTTGIGYRYTAFTGGGKRLWGRAFRSTITGDWPFTYVATDYVVTADVFDGLPGRATDLLMASGAVFAPTWELESGVIEAAVVDGRDGSIVEHPVPEIGVGFVPFAGAFGDFDRDRLDDYVFVNERPNAGPGGDEEEVPVTVGTGVVAARRGTDGFPLWTGGGIELSGQNAQLNDLGDVMGTPEGDVFLETDPISISPTDGDRSRTYAFEGADGLLVWKRRGLWPYSPGDVNRDGNRDVLTMRYYSSDGFVATRVRAFTHSGRQLWTREYRTEHPLQTCCSWMIHWGGGWGVGDYDGDWASDGHIWQWASGGPTELDDRTEQFVIDASSGRILVEGGEELQPLGRPAVDGGHSDYARVRQEAGAVRIDVYDGTTSSLLFATDLSFDVPLPPKKSYVYVEAGRLDGDRCADVAVDVHSPVGSFEVMLDGGDGSLLWWRSLGLRDGTVRVTPASDGNDGC